MEEEGCYIIALVTGQFLGQRQTFFLFIVFLHSSEFSCAVSHNRDYNAIWLHTAESLLEI